MRSPINNSHRQEFFVDRFGFVTYDGMFEFRFEFEKRVLVFLVFELEFQFEYTVLDCCTILKSDVQNGEGIQEDLLLIA